MEHNTASGGSGSSSRRGIAAALASRGACHIKALAGNRLVVDNSPCFGAPGSMPLDNFHIQTDLEDFHRYFLIPDAAESWDRWVAEFAQRPA